MSDPTPSPYQQGINTADRIIARYGRTTPDASGRIYVTIAGCLWHNRTMEWCAWHCGFAWRIARRNERAKRSLIVTVGPPSEVEPDPSGLIPPGSTCRSWSGHVRSGNVRIAVNPFGEREVVAQVWHNLPLAMRSVGPAHVAPVQVIRVSQDEARSLVAAILGILGGEE